MSKFNFLAEGSIHEGGTKYYQVIRIQPWAENRGVVVTHWGAYHPGAPSEPRMHGSCKVELLNNGVQSRYNDAVKKKQKNGYTNWKTTESLQTDDFGICEIINKWFKPEDAGRILLHLAAKTDFDHPTPEVDDDVVAEAEPIFEAPKSAEWGTW